MTSNDYNEMRKRECEQTIPSVFHVHLPVKRFICDDIEVGEDSYATLFESGSDLYALIVSSRPEGHSLADVKRIVKQMGLQADRFFPPGADPRYFLNHGVRQYQKIYPDKKRWQPYEIDFYASQVRYSPALVRIAAIEGLHRYSPSARTWQQVLDVTFRKVRVS